MDLIKYQLGIKTIEDASESIKQYKENISKMQPFLL